MPGLSARCFSGLFLSYFSRGWLGRIAGGFLRCGRFFPSGWSSGSGLFFGRLFVRIAPIVCNIKAGTLEDEARARAQQTLYLAMSPFWQPAEIFGTLAKWFIAHRLERFKILTAFLTRILVGWHERVN